jgi:hypothetical protein
MHDALHFDVANLHPLALKTNVESSQTTFLSPLNQRSIILLCIVYYRIKLWLISDLWSQSLASIEPQSTSLGESVNFSQSMSDTSLRDCFHLLSNKTLSVEDQPQKDSIIQPSGIVNLYEAELATFTINELTQDTEVNMLWQFSAT